jgi:transposase-like protein
MTDVLCKFCNSGKTMKYGIRHTLKYGDSQMYRCVDCKKRFTLSNDDKYNRMRLIIFDLHIKGMSKKNISDHMQKFYDADINLINKNMR